MVLKAELEKLSQQIIIRESEDRWLGIYLSALVNKIIDEDDKIHPELAHINNEYAFECMGVPITIGYVFHAIHKASYKGTHVMEVGLTLEDKWDNLTLMLEAYKDYLELSE